MRLRTLVLLVIALSPTAFAGPAVVTFDFNATVSSSSIAQISLGDAVTGVFTLTIPSDTTNNFSSSNYNWIQYNYASAGETSLSVTDTTANLTITAGGAGDTITVAQGLQAGDDDLLNYDSSTVSWPGSITSFPSNQAELQFSGTGPGSALSSDALPTSLSLSGWSAVSLYFNTYGTPDPGFTANITSISAAGAGSTPEPGTFVLCGGMIAAAALSRRYRRRA